MARIFITGSSDGIGQAAAKVLTERGHAVVLHARNPDRAATTQAAVPKAETVLIGDLTSIAETKRLAEKANQNIAQHGGQPFDAIIHNAGIGYGRTANHSITADGVSAVFSVNTLAPYILTCLIKRPAHRLLFMSSDSHYGGDGSLRNAALSHSYSDSKLHDVMLANAFARRWPDIQVVSMHPGWVRTKVRFLLTIIDRIRRRLTFVFYDNRWVARLLLVAWTSRLRLWLIGLLDRASSLAYQVALSLHLTVPSPLNGVLRM